VHDFEKGCDGCDGFGVRLKADELRVMAIAFGFAAQNFLRQQRLTPKGDEAFGVEIFWVQSPESHRQKLTVTPKNAKSRESPDNRQDLLGSKPLTLQIDGANIAKRAGPRPV